MEYKKIAGISIAFILAFPLAVFAHAIPVASSPESSSAGVSAPKSVSVTFSERPDSAASFVSVKGPQGNVVSTGDAKISSSDPKTMTVGLTDGGKGAYLVSWSVVSADDGHFTKGAYAFEVGSGGSGNTAASTTMSSVEVIVLATKPEIFSMTIELFGNGLIWATLLLFAFAVRPIMSRYSRDKRAIFRLFGFFMTAAIALALVGAVLQLVVKSSELGSIRDISILPAFFLYVQTSAGGATLFRFLAVVGVAGVYAFTKKTVYESTRVTFWEILMGALMCAFAFFRAVISHATANPFHPHISVAFNFLHLIEKDIWAGICFILLVLVLLPRMREFVSAILPRASLMLAIDFAAVAVTATYIVWLHLKSFGNLFTTQWGSVFLDLLFCAILLVALRTYHVVSARWRPQLFARFFSATIGAEFACALLVVYCSSAVIITSPPLAGDPATSYSSSNNGIFILLQPDATEDGMLRILSSEGEPVVSVEDKSDTLGPVSVELSRRAKTSYVFPSAILSNGGPYSVNITVPNINGLDAHANFEVPRGAFADVDSTHTRSFDTFSKLMSFIALAALLYATGLYFVSKYSLHSVGVRTAQVAGIVGFLITICIGGNFIAYADSTSLWNPFRALCEEDGNMWHVMLPMKAGKPTSQITQEGCMWGMGRYTYMFPDKSEYDYNKRSEHAVVTLAKDSDSLIAGKPATLTFALKEVDGSPATLFVDMEKLLHVVIVSADESVFAHIHADDLRALTSDEIHSSTFSVPFTFPKAGTYLISVDYAHGTTLESKQFEVNVQGDRKQAVTTQTYPSEGDFGGYHVSLKYELLFAGSITTMRYEITKNGLPVKNLEPYLSAAMHISAVKNDLSKFIHIHGEVHPVGQTLPAIRIKDGQVVHSMAMMMTPDSFGPNVEAHLVFPTPGLYTIWGEFKADGKVVPTSFTVRVE